MIKNNHNIVLLKTPGVQALSPPVNMKLVNLQRILPERCICWSMAGCEKQLLRTFFTFNTHSVISLNRNFLPSHTVGSFPPQIDVSLMVWWVNLMEHSDHSLLNWNVLLNVPELNPYNKTLICNGANGFLLSALKACWCSMQHGVWSHCSSAALVYCYTSFDCQGPVITDGKPKRLLHLEPLFLSSDLVWKFVLIWTWYPRLSTVIASIILNLIYTEI